MGTVNVAAISRDPHIKDQLARAFDAAPPEWIVTLHDEPPAHAETIVYGPDVVHDRPGIAFDPSRPDRVIGDVVRATSGSRRLAVLVTSLTGGTGVTSLALHLAESLGADCYLDLAGGVAERVRLPDTALNWADAPDLRLAALPVAGGFRVLLAPTEWETGSSDDVRRGSIDALDAAIEMFESVVVDIRPGPSLRAVLERVTAGVLVIHPSQPAARRAARFLDLHHEVPWALVCNRMGPGGETTRRGIERILGRRVAIELPCSPALRDAEDDGRLVRGPWNRYRWGVQKLARALRAT